MDKARRRRGPFSRITVLAIVAGGHVLLVMLFASSRPSELRLSSRSESGDVFVLLDLPSEPATPPEELPEQEPVQSSASIASPRPPIIGSDDPDSSAASAPRADSPGSEPIGTSPDFPVDWDLEAQRTAEAMAPGLLRQHQRECEEAKQHGRYPPGCKKPDSAYEPHWEPEEKRAGLLPLPFVRIGKRCIVALGFFNCTLGKLPDPNGKIFENMYDTERPRSSVPEVPASVWPEPPAPQVLKEQ